MRTGDERERRRGTHTATGEARVQPGGGAGAGRSEWATGSGLPVGGTGRTADPSGSPREAGGPVSYVDEVTEGSMESFPASDPPSWMGGTTTLGPPRR